MKTDIMAVLIAAGLACAGAPCRAGEAGVAAGSERTTSNRTAAIGVKVSAYRAHPGSEGNHAEDLRRLMRGVARE